MARHGILLHIDGPIILLVPNGRLVVPVHHNQLDLNVGMKGRSATVAGPHSENELSPLVWCGKRLDTDSWFSDGTMASGMQQ